VRKAAQERGMKAIPKTRPGNVTPFVLEGCWTLDALDQPTMRLLRKIADRERVKVADVIHGALELFVAKCEAEADLEKKIIKFPMPLKKLIVRWITDSSSKAILQLEIVAVSG